ncbi:beta-defensin 118-like [Dipodomys spectabilis]|uniref:beta-defensin 118-like n=1 Tax=Dipodomys spectabilis TaxID=105255 RepID=UPI001C548B9C|nr:beta-defensin 118-like [Dipodomys spectabilis]
MRLLLLTLTILAFLPQVTPAYSGEKKCLSKSGHCRKKCQHGEMPWELCKNHRICCISTSQAFRIRKLIQKTTTAFYDFSFISTSTIMFDDMNPSSPETFYGNEQTTPTTFFDFTDTTKMIPATDNFEAENYNGEKSDKKLATQTPVPAIHHSSS